MDLPKDQWGEGPWQHEPDELEWVDEATGLKCRIRRGPVGALCGYVGLPPTHPAYGLHYDGPDDGDVQEWHDGFKAEIRQDGVFVDTLWNNIPRPTPVPGIGEAIAQITCHGGLTYAAEENGLWWFGFDCCHAGDLCPQLEATLNGLYLAQGEMRRKYPDTYRTLDYVRQECTELAKRLKELENHAPRSAFTDPPDGI